MARRRDGRARERRRREPSGQRAASGDPIRTDVRSKADLRQTGKRGHNAGLHREGVDCRQLASVRVMSSMPQRVPSPLVTTYPRRLQISHLRAHHRAHRRSMSNEGTVARGNEGDRAGLACVLRFPSPLRRRYVAGPAFGLLIGACRGAAELAGVRQRPLPVCNHIPASTSDQPSDFSSAIPREC